MDLSPPLNHVFVDYENVQVLDLDVIRSRGVTFTLLIGPAKRKLDVELVETLFAHAASMELVRLVSSGKNALDFMLAYYVGRAVAADPKGYFHIISKDTGYDPMIKHLRTRNIKVRRHDKFSELTFSDAPKPSATVAVQPALAPPATLKSKTVEKIEGAMGRVLAHLRKHVKNRPKKRKKLVSHLTTVLGKQSTEKGVAQLIEKLTKEGHLAIDAEGAVTYLLLANE